MCTGPLFTPNFEQLRVPVWPSFIGGDFNAHSPFWYDIQSGDRGGDLLEEWYRVFHAKGDIIDRYNSKSMNASNKTRLSLDSTQPPILYERN